MKLLYVSIVIQRSLEAVWSIAPCPSLHLSILCVWVPQNCKTYNLPILWRHNAAHWTMHEYCNLWSKFEDKR